VNRTRFAGTRAGEAALLVNVLRPGNEGADGP
jgi:hypothetical protein